MNRDRIRSTYAQQIMEITTSSRRLAELGYVTSSGGNLSLRVSDDLVLLTPTGVPKGKISEDMIVGVSLNGRIISALPGRFPTSETPMHLGILRRRPDVRAVIHAHPPVLTGFALTDSELLSRPLHPEVIIEVGPVLPVPYVEPTSDVLASAFDGMVDWGNAFLMRNHGVLLCSSEGTERALELLRMLETFAYTCFVALGAGLPEEIPPEEIDRLEAIMRRRNLPMPGKPRTGMRLRDLYRKPGSRAV